MSNKDPKEPSDLEILLEAARRATWDALHGPRHLRSGRFRPTIDEPDQDGEDGHPDDKVDRGST